MRGVVCARWQPERDLDAAVTPIASMRRGQRPIDYFSVMCDAIVHDIFGEAELVVQYNGTAVKLVPPLHFFLRARRDDQTGEVRRVMELIVKAHFAALVIDHGAPGSPIFRTDDVGFLYPMGDREAYKRAMSRALLARAARGEQVTAEFVTWSRAQ